MYKYVRKHLWVLPVLSFTKDLSAISGFEYVDQTGLPFLLRECSKGNPASGPAFSWGGDHENMQDWEDAFT